MKFTFTCKKVPLNDSVKDYAEKKISKLDRYFPEEAEAFVTFAVEKKDVYKRQSMWSGCCHRTPPGWR